MTLIAAIRVGECPILLGDLLISSIIAPGRPISLPTVGDLPEDLALGGTHHVTGTAQKICIVNPRLAVAWAGREIFAKYLIRKMGRCFSGRIINQGSLEKFFNSQDIKHLQELQMICWYGNDKGFNSFGVNTTNIDTENFGHCHVGGTGTGEFIDLIYSEMQYRAHGAPNPLANGVVTALMLASQILANEVVTGANLTLYYGGGIEIATFFDNKYRKVGDILHLFWRYDETKRRNAIELVPILYKLDYLKNDLVIRRILFDEDLKTIARYDTFVTTPIIKPVSPRKLALDKLPDLNAKWFVNHVFLESKTKQRGAKVAVHYSSDREGPFRVTVTKGGFIMSFHRRFFENELQSVMKGYGEFGDAIDVQS